MIIMLIDHRIDKSKKFIATHVSTGMKTLKIISCWGLHQSLDLSYFLVVLVIKSESDQVKTHTMVIIA